MYACVWSVIQRSDVGKGLIWICVDDALIANEGSLPVSSSNLPTDSRTHLHVERASDKAATAVDAYTAYIGLHHGSY